MLRPKAAWLRAGTSNENGKVAEDRRGSRLLPNLPALSEARICRTGSSYGDYLQLFEVSVRFGASIQTRGKAARLTQLRSQAPSFDPVDSHKKPNHFLKRPFFAVLSPESVVIRPVSNDVQEKKIVRFIAAITRHRRKVMTILFLVVVSSVFPAHTPPKRACSAG